MRKVHHWVSLRNKKQQDDFPVHENAPPQEKTEFNRWMVDTLAEMCYNAQHDFDLTVTVRLLGHAQTESGSPSS